MEPAAAPAPVRRADLGLYEWRKSDKAAFRFTVRDEPIFELAGLWDAWKAAEESWLQSFTIITTDPNTVAAAVHDRMPAVGL